MRKLFYLSALLFTASVIFTACDNEPAPPTPEYIVVTDEKSLEQIVYADEKTGASTIEFTTLAPWTSSIGEPTTAQSARSSSEIWVSISPESGGIGEYEIEITLEPNFSGADRTIIITITSGGQSIEIRITQRYVREDGTPPVPTTPTTDPGVVIDGIRWATRNVDAPGTFADRPESSGMLFQFNRKKAWSAINETVIGWDNSNPEGTAWYAENDPCPLGWRVPTEANLRSLYNIGGTWVESWNGTGVSGSIYGTAPNQIFLPATGWRSYFSNGAVLYFAGTLGSYWSNTQYDSTFAWILWVPTSEYRNVGNGRRTHGFPIRCVAE